MKINHYITIKCKSVDIFISLFFFITLLLAFIFGFLIKYLIAFLSIALHEVTHILITLFLGGKVFSVKILPVGLNASVYSGFLGSSQRIAIYLSGPLANLIICITFLILNAYCSIKSDNMVFFIFINFSLALFNLLPVLPLDGGVVIRELYTRKNGLFSAEKTVSRISKVIAVVLIIAGVCQLVRYKYNFSLLLAGIFIFPNLNTGAKEIAFMNLKNIIYKHSRILKKGIYPARNIVAVKSMSLSDILKAMDFDMFHIIYVLDEKLKIIRVFTEQEVIQAAVEKSANITFDELINMNPKDDLGMCENGL